MERREKNFCWQDAPFLRCLLPMLAGSFTEYFFPFSERFAGVLFLSFTATVLVYGIFFLKSAAGSFPVYGLMIQLAFFFLGKTIQFQHRDVQAETTNPDFVWMARLTREPVKRPKTWKAEVEIGWMWNQKNLIREKEKIFIYFKTPDSIPLHQGDLILFRGNLLPVENPGGDKGFDYKRYCRLKHIYRQVFLRSEKFRLINSPRDKSIADLLEKERSRMLRIIESHIPDRQEKGLLEALLAGFTGDLDNQLLKDYADAGVVHIIAISGLHLALICQILLGLLRFMGKRETMQWAKLILVIAGIWAYSVLSGSSPSVVRSALMFTFAMVARNLFREPSLYNILAGSAFFLICFDPGWIRDTGFQLSYSAVLGLRLFTAQVRDLAGFKNKILKGIWEAMAVSFSAQLLTTPLSLYYFHRFPNYFLAANLIAVPLSSLVLVSGLLLWTFSAIGPLADGLGWFLAAQIRLLNHFVSWVAGLPGSVTDGIFLSAMQVSFIYITGFGFYRLLILEKKDGIWSGLAGLLALAILRLNPG